MVDISATINGSNSSDDERLSDKVANHEEKTEGKTAVMKKMMGMLMIMFIQIMSVPKHVWVATHLPILVWYLMQRSFEWRSDKNKTSLAKKTYGDT